MGVTMTTRHKRPTSCPVCSGSLHASEVTCADCGTQIRSAFAECAFCRLSADQLQFVEIFLRSRGNLSGVGDELDISYPTVARRLEAVLAALDSRDSLASAPAAPAPPPGPSRSPTPPVPSLAEPPAAAAPPGKSEEDRARERREILEMLDRGDITADQATRMLQEL